MNGKQLEIRSAALGKVEWRAADDGPGVLRGYAAVFNRYSQNLGGFVERVDPGAFTKSLADEVPVMARYNHDDNYLLGTTEARTLTLDVDDTGLLYDVQLPDTSAGRDVRVLGERGDLRYSSFAFYAIEDEWGFTEQGFPLRTLRAVQLVDVAPVNNPAYRDTSVAVRSLAERAGVDVDDVARIPVDELRARLEQAAGDGDDDEEGQRATHPPVALQRRYLDLEALR